MIIILIQALVLYAVSWLFWRTFFAKSALANIPGPAPKSLWKGAFPQVFNVNAWDFHREMAEKYGSVIKIKALFGENQLYVFDPKAMHHIIVKDQHIYEETSAFLEGNKLIFGHGLLSTLDEQHRKQRKMLNPVFSIAHMRGMNAFTAKVNDGPQEIDVLSWMTRTALELIGQSGLGYSFDSLTEGGIPHPYSTSTKQLIPSTFKFFFLRTYFLSTLFRRFVVDLLPWKSLHDLRDIIDVLHNTSVEIFESKKKALKEGDEAVATQIGQGKDILSILMRANMRASKEDSLTQEELLAQMSTLTFAATDTTSSALSRTLLLLATHQHVQDKLREEIRQARKQHNSDLDYDDLVSLPYLDASAEKALGCQYPPVSFVSRTTRQDVVLPLSKPIKGIDGQEIHEIPIPNNTNVVVGILEANRNPDIWGPDSHEWKPERWLNPLPDTVAAAHVPGIYSHLMTFIGGGRACIGFKFSQLEMKVVLSLLIDSFRFSPSDKEIFWQMNAISSPTLAKLRTDTHSQLPLIVERAA
ncbi:cytochrome P450 [Flammula alnicola]|nr:cytochrome P450 [Flammula alnicola]